METKLDEPLDRPKESRVLAEARRKSHINKEFLDPGRRMEAAFSLSMDARMLLVAGLRAQGFSETEIRAISGSKP